MVSDCQPAPLRDGDNGDNGDNDHAPRPSVVKEEEPYTERDRANSVGAGASGIDEVRRCKLDPSLKAPSCQTLIVKKG